MSRYYHFLDWKLTQLIEKYIVTIRRLTAKEYEQIYQKVWKEEAFGNANNAIACYVRNLREKIGRLLPEGCFVI